MNLAEIYDAYRGDPAFDHLRTPGIILVGGEGSSRPNVLIVGEAPGATENTLRRPFVGASGRVLRSLITDSAGLSAEEYFITNVVKYRPPGNRTPEHHEVQASMPYLRQEYAALGSPSVIIAVGGTALGALKRPQDKLGTLSHAGKLIRLSRGRWLVPMIHPSFGLRNRSARPKMDLHWEEFGKWYKETFR